MKNVYLFLPKTKRAVLGIAAAAFVTLNVLAGTVLFEHGKEDASLAVVYAQDNTVKAASRETGEDTDTVTKAPEEMEQEQVHQIQVDEQMEAIAAESVAAMQNDLAEFVAREEKKIQLSQTDKEVLLRIVEAEATGQDVTGKLLVANVVLNRVNSDKFPDTVEEVVFQKEGGKYQFSPIRDGRYYMVDITDSTEEAVELALYGEDKSQGALYFMARRHANSNNVRWFDRNLTWLLEYGTHEFYK